MREEKSFSQRAFSICTYIRKLQDKAKTSYMQVRLDKLYDEIEEIETFIEAVETRLYNIKQKKISGDNVYQFLLFFDNLYDRFTDMEKKIFMKSFLEEGNIYEVEQEDGRILRSLKFRYSVRGAEYASDCHDDAKQAPENPVPYSAVKSLISGHFRGY